MHQSGIRRRLVFAFTSVVLVLITFEIVISVIGYQTSSTYNKILQNLVLESSFAQNVPEFITSYNTLLTIDQPTEGVTNAYKQSEKSLQNSINLLDQNIRNPESTAKYLGLRNFVLGIIQDSDRGVEAKNVGDNVTANAIYDRTLAKSEFLNQNIVDLILAEMNYASILSKQTDQLIKTLFEIGTVILFMLMAAIFYFIWSFSRKLTQPLIELEKLVQRVQNADLDIVVDPKFMSRKDEIGSLSTSFSVMAKRLSENIIKVEEKTNELSSERDRAQAIVSSMGEGLLVVDKHSNLTSINPAAEKLLNIHTTDYIGKPWSAIATTLKGNQSVPDNERTFLQTLETGKIIVTSIDDDHYYKTHDGRTFPVASTTAPLTSGKEIVGAVKVFRDITEEKGQKALIEKTVTERTKELREEKAKLSASIASLSLGFMLVDQHGKILVMNPALTQALNLKKPVTQFSEIGSLLKDSVDLTSLLDESHKKLRPIEKKDVVFSDKYLKIFLAPILAETDGKKVFLGTVILLEDVTEAKVMERSKDEFFSIASHELRTPLTAIRGNTSMILEMYKEKVKDPDLLEMLNDINTSSVQLIGIVNDFLNISRLEQGKMEFKEELFDVASMVKDVIVELNSIKTQKNVKLKLVANTKEPPQARADQNKTKEIIINLVGNALKFTEKGSVIISITKEGAFLKISIQDTGRGIPLPLQNLLFRKFQQAGSSLYTRDTTKGTGLGLYISKMMVEGMGGSIELEKSEENVGSTFTFTLKANS